MQEAFLFDSLRTPIGTGGPQGALYEVKPVDLLATLLRAIPEKMGLEASRFEDMITGCVTPIDDQGFNLGKAALLRAGWPAEVGALLVHRFAASGLEAVNLAALKVRCGGAKIMLAGGVESESRVPAGSEGGPLIHDPALINASSYPPEGIAADLLATLEGFTREALDDYALRAFTRHAAGRKDGDPRDASIIPIRDRNGLVLLERDETPHENMTREKLENLEPAFAQVGREGFDAMALRRYPRLSAIRHLHTSGNCAARADGAALLLIGDRQTGEAAGLTPRARLLAMGNAGVDTTLMLTGAVPAARAALEKSGLEAEQIDLWACHDPFAAVGLHFQQAFAIPPEKLNIWGGTIPGGQALGAAGGILLGQLLQQLEARDAEFGLAAAGGGGAMGVATLIQRI